MSDITWNVYLVLFENGDKRLFGAEDLQDLVETVKRYVPSEPIVGVYKDMDYSEIENES
jgi:hypothetical protein